MQLESILEHMQRQHLGKVNDSLIPLLKQVFELGQRTPGHVEEAQIYTPDQQRVANFLVERSQGAMGAGMDPIGFLIASYEYMGNQLKGSQSANTDKLRQYCEQFIKDQRIHCAEDVYQSDRVIENAYEFIHGICDIVGYHSLDNSED